ncbi:hypothetical protein NLG97_g6958 [Lecanicillium saksenae]|uniref:Uncharacterized protein n=1 Tax=Lecanicillium saksenae TaxID=468837 RepID=A0ACC1QN97_9HYPO|nr:hypothetical protein NLG97_g6958 [Lecanicillium saksenae]
MNNSNRHGRRRRRRSYSKARRWRKFNSRKNHRRDRGCQTDDDRGASNPPGPVIRIVDQRSDAATASCKIFLIDEGFCAVAPFELTKHVFNVASRILDLQPRREGSYNVFVAPANAQASSYAETQLNSGNMPSFQAIWENHIAMAQSQTPQAQQQQQQQHREEMVEDGEEDEDDSGGRSAARGPREKYVPATPTIIATFKTIMRGPQQLLAAASASLLISSPAIAGSVDYVVVGGGTSGLLVANRLSRDAGTTVALIDPGSDERENPIVKSPNDWLKIFGDYVAEPHVSVEQPHANNRTLTFYSGRGIGGTSLINGMTYLRGDKSEFDSWEKLGNKGWNWDSMVKYYKKLEGFVTPEQWQVDAGATFEPVAHGFGGDLHTCFNPKLLKGSWYNTTIEAWTSLGVAKIKDVNSGSVRGFDVWPQTIDAKTNTRWDAASAFYWPVHAQRRNLHLINGTASRLLWDEKKTKHDEVRASGVEYTSANGSLVQLSANKQVILAAGALRTPLILENSGIGQAARLKSNSISVVVDLPGVGENLVDNPLTPYVYKSDVIADGYTPYSTFLTAHDLFGNSMSQTASYVKGQISSWAKQVVNRSNGALDASAIEKLMYVQHDVIFKKNATIVEIVQSAQDGALSGAAWNLLPFSRGSIHISGKGISKYALDPQFLAVDYDLDTTIAIGKAVRSFYNSSQIRPHVTGYLNPTADQLPENPSEDDWRKFIPSAVGPNNHPLGTASMMARDLGGVVDPKLKVYGTANVRVVDASVVPTQLSGHLTATIYAIAERASEFIVGF